MLRGLIRSCEACARGCRLPELHDQTATAFLLWRIRVVSLVDLLDVSMYCPGHHGVDTYCSPSARYHVILGLFVRKCYQTARRQARAFIYMACQSILTPWLPPSWECVGDSGLLVVFDSALSIVAT